MGEAEKPSSNRCKKGTEMGCESISWIPAQGFRILNWLSAMDLLPALGWDLVSAAPNASSTSSPSSPNRRRALASRLHAGDELFMNSSTCIAVQEETQIGSARRCAVGICERISNDETFCGKAAIVVTEMARNLVQHGHGGEIVLREIASR